MCKYYQFKYVAVLLKISRKIDSCNWDMMKNSTATSILGIKGAKEPKFSLYLKGKPSVLSNKKV